MDWTDLASPAAQTVTVAGTAVFNASDVGYQWVRVVWTETPAAAGAVTGRVHGKGAT